MITVPDTDLKTIFNVNPGFKIEQKWKSDKRDLINSSISGIELTYAVNLCILVTPYSKRSISLRYSFIPCKKLLSKNYLGSKILL